MNTLTFDEFHAEKAELEKELHQKISMFFDKYGLVGIGAYCSINDNVTMDGKKQSFVSRVELDCKL